MGIMMKRQSRSWLFFLGCIATVATNSIIHAAFAPPVSTMTGPRAVKAFAMRPESLLLSLQSSSTPLFQLSMVKIPSTDVEIPTIDPDMVRTVIRGWIDSLDAFNSKWTNAFDAFVTTTLETMRDSDQFQQAQLLQQSMLEQSNILLTTALKQYPALQPFYDTLQEAIVKMNSAIQMTLSSPSATPLLLVISAVLSYSVLSLILSLGKPPPPSKPYPLETYDALSSRLYFDARPLQVWKRGFDVVTNSVGFGLRLLQDYINKTLDQNADQRAVELARLLTQLGPTFIKVGQSLSIRTDLLSPAYVRGLQTLQDQVPAFDTAVAQQMMQEEWGISNIESVVRMTSSSSSTNSRSVKPVAAASLGQVYRAVLQDGTQREVAIKVQRPNIMEQIALDMYLLREIFAPLAKRLLNLNSDTVGTVDAWGKGFVDELDYLQEGRNAETFMESIQVTPLKDVVFAPAIVPEYTTGKVLMTEWVEGERLDKSSNQDVTVLCSIAMNSYLTMMLETGLLHCDPHPGNLLRTQDGKLCILDWGMVTRLDKELQLTLIEHMAHLTSADYAEIPKDLLLLGFIPQSKADLIRDSGVVEVLADIYGAWTKGGGAAAINVNQVVAQLQDLTATRGNLFQIPPYFAYIAKSFSVLEGIGLSNDPNYSIINECLPYVSKRLLTDQSDRTGGALSTFIFGADKGNIDTRIVNYDRVEQLVTGFGNYTTSASGALLGKESLSRAQRLETAADQLLDLILVEDETPLQSIFLEQLAKIITSSTRSLWTELRERSGTLPSGRTVLGTLVDPLGFWRTSPLVRMNDLDTRTVDTTRKLIALMQQQIQESNNPMFDVSNLSQEEILELSTILVRKVWSRRSGVLKTGNRLATQLLKLTADKLERGERDTIRLPPRPVQDTASAKTTSSASPTTTHQPPSTRLQNARQRLSQLESLQDEPYVPEEVEVYESVLIVDNNN